MRNLKHIFRGLKKTLVDPAASLSTVAIKIMARGCLGIAFSASFATNKASRCFCMETQQLRMPRFIHGPSSMSCDVHLIEARPTHPHMTRSERRRIELDGNIIHWMQR